MIAAGLGVGFSPQYSWGALDTEDVLLLPIESPLCQRDIVVTYNENKADNSEVRKYYDFLVDYFEALKKER
jgi:DNA-binding transcriptional LysR family regulator